MMYILSIWTIELWQTFIKFIGSHKINQIINLLGPNSNRWTIFQSVCNFLELIFGKTAYFSVHYKQIQLLDMNVKQQQLILEWNERTVKCLHFNIFTNQGRLK